MKRCLPLFEAVKRGFRSAERNPLSPCVYCLFRRELGHQGGHLTGFIIVFEYQPHRFTVTDATALFNDYTPIP